MRVAVGVRVHLASPPCRSSVCACYSIQRQQTLGTQLLVRARARAAYPRETLSALAACQTLASWGSSIKHRPAPLALSGLRFELQRSTTACCVMCDTASSAAGFLAVINTSPLVTFRFAFKLSRRPDTRTTYSYSYFIRKASICNTDNTAVLAHHCLTDKPNSPFRAVCCASCGLDTTLFGHIPQAVHRHQHIRLDADIEAHPVSDLPSRLI